MYDPNKKVYYNHFNFLLESVMCLLVSMIFGSKEFFVMFVLLLLTSFYLFVKHTPPYDKNKELDIYYEKIFKDY